MPVHEKTWKAKIPLLYVLLFLLNIALVVLVEIALLYTQPLTHTPKTLADFDTVYENCTILDTVSASNLNCHLVQTQEGETHLIPSQRHSFFINRCRILEDQITLIPEEESTTVSFKIGVHKAKIIVIYDTFYEQVDYSSGGYRETTTKYLLLGALLEFLEMGAYALIKKNL